MTYYGITIPRTALLCVLCLSYTVMGADGPRFEVASVKQAATCGLRSSITAASVTLAGIPLKPILVTAFGVKSDQITGPSWLESNCFDIVAKMPEGSSPSQMPAMLQALLADRFKMTFEREERLTPGYVMVVDKGGPKVMKHDPQGNFLRGHAGQTLFGAGGHGALKGVMTMAALASSLSAKGYGPVQDQTGLIGDYDIDLSWTQDRDFEQPGLSARVPGAQPEDRDARPAPEPEGSLFTALRETLGLRLERQRTSVPMIVIRHIERVPTQD